MRMLTAVLLMGPTIGLALSARQAPSRDAVTPLLGHWESGTEADVAIVTADARKWHGKPPADIDALGRRLFGAAPPELIVNVSSSGAFPLAVINAIKQVQQGTLEVEFKMIAGESDQIAGLVFDLQPSGDYLYVRYNTRDDNVALWRFTKGQREVIAHGADHRRLAMNTWHPLSVTIKGRSISAAAAGDLRLAHTLDRDVSGRAGLWTKRDSVTAFRDWRHR